MKHTKIIVFAALVLLFAWITPIPAHAATTPTVKLSSTSYTYDGQVKTPVVSAYNSKGTEINPAYYSVTYQSGRKNVGTYKVRVTFQGKWEAAGSVTETFKIKPQGTTIVSAAGKVNGLYLKWNLQKTQTTGYQLQYSRSSSFDNPTNVWITDNTTYSKSIAKLSEAKNYFVRVRTYKIVNGTKYYSKYSAAKKVRTKNNIDCLMLGDSITWYDGHYSLVGPKELIKGYKSYLLDAGMKSVNNQGVSGACLAYHKNNYEDIITTAKRTDFTGYELVTIAGGVNDYKFFPNPIGKIRQKDFDEKTVIGALQSIITRIYKQNPNTRIVLCTPLKCTGYSKTNELGYKLADYTKAIKEVGKYYNLEVIDLYNYTTFVSNIRTYTMDGVHPNNAGYKKICSDVLVPAIM